MEKSDANKKLDYLTSLFEDVLRENGQYSQYQTSIQAALFSALKCDSPVTFKALNLGHKMNKCEGIDRLIGTLIIDYLEFNQVKATLSTFQVEIDKKFQCQAPEELSRVLHLKESKSQPLLYSVINFYFYMMEKLSKSPEKLEFASQTDAAAQAESIPQGNASERKKSRIPTIKNKSTEIPVVSDVKAKKTLRKVESVKSPVASRLKRIAPIIPVEKVQKEYNEIQGASKKTPSYLRSTVASSSKKLPAKKPGIASDGSLSSASSVESFPRSRQSLSSASSVESFSLPRSRTSSGGRKLEKVDAEIQVEKVDAETQVKAEEAVNDPLDTQRGEKRLPLKSLNDSAIAKSNEDIQNSVEIAAKTQKAIEKDDISDIVTEYNTLYTRLSTPSFEDYEHDVVGIDAQSTKDILYYLNDRIFNEPKDETHCSDDDSVIGFSSESPQDEMHSPISIHHKLMSPPPIFGYQMSPHCGYILSPSKKSKSEPNSPIRTAVFY